MLNTTPPPRTLPPVPCASPTPSPHFLILSRTTTENRLLVLLPLRGILNSSHCLSLILLFAWLISAASLIQPLLLPPLCLLCVTSSLLFSSRVFLLQFLLQLPFRFCSLYKITCPRGCPYLFKNASRGLLFWNSLVLVLRSCIPKIKCIDNKLVIRRKVL